MIDRLLQEPQGNADLDDTTVAKTHPDMSPGAALKKPQFQISRPQFPTHGSAFPVPQAQFSNSHSLFQAPQAAVSECASPIDLLFGESL